MGQYRLLIKASAAKELMAIPTKRDRQRIVKKIQGLGAYPRPPGSQKLSGRERYRIRQGRYRIICGIEKDDLVVYAVKVDIAKMCIVNSDRPLQRITAGPR